MRGRPKKLVALSDLVSRVLSQRHGHANHGREAVAMKVFAAFTQIGPPLTQHAEPVLLRGGILTLTVTDSAWLTELTFLRPEILERLNRPFNKIVVRDLRMRLGAITRKKVVEVPLPPLSPEKQHKVETWASEIADDEVRAAVTRAASRSLATPQRTPRFIEGPPGPMRSAPVVAAPVDVPAAPAKDRWSGTRDRFRKK